MRNKFFFDLNFKIYTLVIEIEKKNGWLLEAVLASGQNVCKNSEALSEL